MNIWVDVSSFTEIKITYFIFGALLGLCITLSLYESSISWKYYLIFVPKDDGGNVKVECLYWQIMCTRYYTGRWISVRTNKEIFQIYDDEEKLS